MNLHLHRSPAASARLRMLASLGGTALAILAAVWVAYGPRFAPVVQAAGFHPHWPDLGLVLRAPPAVQAHLAAVLCALAIGVLLMTGRKGATAHRVLGWVWSVFMLTGAASGLFINSRGGFNPIHLFSVFVLITVPLAIYAARRRDVARHRKSMAGVFWGGLIVAGLFAFLPGRLMWMMVFG